MTISIHLYQKDRGVRFDIGIKVCCRYVHSTGHAFPVMDVARYIVVGFIAVLTRHKAQNLQSYP